VIGDEEKLGTSVLRECDREVLAATSTEEDVASLDET
jgi:hypothetical protein